MERQMRVALVNDMTGFGRCSITVELPLLSAMKIQACPFPTAILSVHTGFTSHYIDDYTERMRPYMENWKENGLEFDGICTGFLGSVEQIGIVEDFIAMFKGKGTRVMVDPVMGDNGRLYASYSPRMCEEMRRLLIHADLVTPNLTEACELLDISYPQGGIVSDRDLQWMAEELSRRGPRQVVITGLLEADTVKNFIYERERGTEVFRMPKIDGERSGTGDAFAAIVAGSLLHGETLSQAVQKAAVFISKMIRCAVKMNLPWNYGLPFEEYLTQLR